MSDFHAQIMRQILKAERLGSRKLANGVHLIGNVPHNAPEAYLHVTFPGLDDSQIAVIEEQITRPLPEALRAFYRKANGMELFGYSLSIYGLRTSSSRAGDEAWQPFSIMLPNTTERPSDADGSLVFFGFYEWDGSQLAMSSESPAVYRCAAESATRINEWPSFEAMLVSEVDRLASLFDENGRKGSEEVPTTPD